MDWLDHYRLLQSMMSLTPYTMQLRMAEGALQTFFGKVQYHG